MLSTIYREKFYLVRLLFISIIFVNILLVSDSLSDTNSPKPDNVTLNRDRAYFHQDPGGAILGEFYTKMQGQVLETRGEWSRVVVSGWIKSSYLTKQDEAVKEPPSLEQISIISYNVQEKQYTVSETRRQLSIKVKNNTARLISSWAGVVVAKDAKDRVVMRDSVSDSKANLEPGAVKELFFIYSPKDKQYSELLAIKDGKMRLGIAEAMIK